MIIGRVALVGTQAGIAFLEPRIVVGVADSSRVFQMEEAVVDTGFNGWLTLPENTIQQLGLTYLGRRPANQASGEERMFDIYSALVSWHDHPRPVLVHQSESKPLIGMALLTNCRITVDAREGGDVIIEEILF